MTETEAKKPGKKIVLTIMLFPALMGLLITAIVIYPVIKEFSHNSDLLAHGVAAPATILGLRDTGSRVNMKSLVEITLEVTPEDGPEFQSKAEFAMSMVDVTRLQPGNVVTVKYDPNDLQRVAIVTGP